MVVRLASILALIAFALCLVVGGVHADNPFGTTVTRALGAMVGTLVVGLVIGWMAQKMLDENVRVEAEKRKESQANEPAADR